MRAHSRRASAGGVSSFRDEGMKQKAHTPEERKIQKRQDRQSHTKTIHRYGLLCFRGYESLGRNPINGTKIRELPRCINSYQWI